MSNYAVFIWSAYGATALALGGLVLLSLLARRNVRRELSARGLERPREQRAGTTR
jgi:heme exporter protein CcmD